MKKKLTNRIISLLLAVTMCLSLAVPAAATEPEENSGLIVTQVDNSSVTSGSREPEAVEEDESAFTDTDRVCVSIVLSGKTGL